jgi:hypothetical protein
LAKTWWPNNGFMTFGFAAVYNADILSMLLSRVLTDAAGSSG